MMLDGFGWLELLMNLVGFFLMDCGWIVGIERRLMNHWGLTSILQMFPPRVRKSGFKTTPKRCNSVEPEVSVEQTLPGGDLIEKL